MNMKEAFTVNAPLETTRAFLRDPEMIAPCMPGVASVVPRDETTYDVVATVQVIAKTAHFRIVAEITHETEIHLEGRASGEDIAGGGAVDLEGQLDLTPLDSDSTKVAFSLVGTLDGKMVHFGTGPAINYQSSHMAKQFANEVQKRIEASISN